MEFGMQNSSSYGAGLNQQGGGGMDWYTPPTSGYNNYSASTSGTRQNPNQMGGNSFEDEPPLLEELGIDLGGILVKTRSVLFHRLNNRLLDDLDMGGALVFVIVLGGLHLLMGKIHFGVILGWSVVHSVVLWYLINQLAGSGAAESKGLDLYSVCCVVGYCMVPLVVHSAISLLLPRGLLSLVLAVFCTIWNCDDNFVRLQKLAIFSAVAGVTGFAYYKTASPSVQFDVISGLGPILRLLDPETAHNMGIAAAKWGLFPKETRDDPSILRTKVWGRDFRNPIGLAAGFDKNGEIIESMFGLGFGFVEVGSITPKPQPGNLKPRVFRIPELKATINRYGFNNIGAEAVEENLQIFLLNTKKDPTLKKGLLGVNLGKNKTSADAATDYSIGISKLARYADYLVINVSSPNTPGLRALQGRTELEALVKQVKATRDRMPWSEQGPPPLLVKIAPDLSETDKVDIATVVTDLGVDGLIISNTTIQRPGPVSDYPQAKETGGLSGPPLFALATQTLSDMYRLTGGKIPIVGCGGVSSGEDAYKKIRAGASLVQIYTALAYEGPKAVPDIKEGLAACLKRDGFKSVAEAVGADHKSLESRLHSDLKSSGKKGLLW
ncbi:hypothetical protein CEUSTIGMA_g8303.t1 [Chlamydomonas eustigma]|uniref:Dihydroorotate dehydrogenase (quinone), mitochondrial n=1 Tax=Chlamydomonas eustigma TaxID=1157962 RepID=A0A250XCQ4_9CHLO|nr:hypothetical protein CEUSTIGMA_g8303.t1 [Chlamydomonas eustigma]|eukprot:GAX80868.1 hypothetical protein CEUSTIGMA_g8303.t1 [Chlamydomonas eustigma]